MSKSTKMTCDCGCGISVTVIDPRESRWLILSKLVPKDGSEPENELKLYRELQFRSFECLENWVQKANLAIPRLKKSANELTPRGLLRDDSVEGLYI